MALVNYKNPWATSGSQIDPVRPDLFRLSINLPDAVLGGGTSVWDGLVNFAVQSFPFPERAREMIPIKWLQQTNFSLGADVPSGPVEVSVRWAYNQQTAEVLERWHQLSSNAQTGGVAKTTDVKASGYFYYLIPNADIVDLGDPTANDVMQDGPAFYLEGVLCRGLKPEDNADMTVGNAVQRLSLSLQIDRYYPINYSDLTFLTA